MKKLSILLMVAIMLLCLTACTGNGQPTTTAAPQENTAPTFSGVADQTVEAGSEFDALIGVTAADAEDGDRTALITIDATPALTFLNGKTVPEAPGSYELTYSVTDKDGLTTEAYATLTVSKKTSAEEVYKHFDFSTQQVTDAKGWEARIGEDAAATAALKEGAYVFDITNPGSGDGAVQLAKPGFTLKPASYRVKVWVKSTKETYAHLIARDENAEGWVTFDGVFNAKIGTEITPIELNFTAENAGSAELLFNLGKITPNPENASDTTPENFTVTIDKIEIYEITGVETRTPMYTADFTTGNGASIAAGDGASASIAYEGNSAKAAIENYPTDGGVWSIKADLLLGETAIEAGQKYYYSFTVNAKNAQSGECLVESAAQFDAVRVHFNGITLPAGEDTVVTGVFTADKDVSDPVIRLQIGNPSEGVTANVLTIKDVVVGKVTGDLDTRKTIDSFCAFGRNTANGADPDHAWETFNGTDEDNPQGVGTIWAENGSFFYRIDQGGTVDWHNKLIYGYNGNPLTLASDSYYVLEITAKASKDVSCGVFLNPLGGWDPRIAESMALTTEPQTFRFATKDIFITDMDFELLFQFGSEATSQLGEVTVEFTDITLYQSRIQ